ncbi:MAG: thiol reductant ABC exporter subunit CydC [Lachnospiraceae bacterium]|nr:thiol reductant ABC exporter subunit CydC [Lachnospiraceae bacterium]
MKKETKKSLSFLLKLLQPYRPSVMGAALIGTLTILANTGLLALSAILICLAALMPPVLDLMPMSAGVRLCGISRGIFRYWERLSSHSITFRLLEDLRVWYYRQLLPLTPGGTMNKTAKLLKSVTEDLETLQFFYLRVVAAPLVALLTLVSVSGILAFLLPQAIPVLWIAGLVNGLLLPLLSRKKSRKHAPAALSHELNFRHHLQDFVMGLEALWVYQGCDDQKEETLASYLAGNRLRQEGETERGRLNALSGICSGLALTATLWLGVIAVDQGRLRGIYLLAAALLVLGALEAVQPLPLAVSYYYDSIAAMDNMLEITEGKPTGLSREENSSSPLPTCTSAPGITFRQVSFTYPEGKKEALKKVSFELPAGSNTAVIGHVGSGKSSLVALLMGYFQPDEGEITLGGIPLNCWGKEALCRQISLVEQSPYLFTASLKENLELASGPQTEEKLWEALEWAQLSTRARALPEKLDTLLSPEGQNFSSGERQRLALARMYLENKPVVILDESLKNLDNTTSRLLLEKILEFCKDRTLLMISHDQSHPAYMDYLLAMDGGCAVLEKI